MKKIDKHIIIFSFVIMLIFGLIFFSVDKYNSNQKTITYLAGDTDGITSTKLSNLKIIKHESDITFDSDTLEYTLYIFKTEYWLNIQATPNDSDAKVTISGADYLPRDVNKITITVSNGVEADTTYTIMVEKRRENTVYTYSTATKHSFTATNSGYYKFEAWGASGQSLSSCTGAKGGYTSGILKVNLNDTYYIHVGAHNSSTSTIYNSIIYNGGGGGSWYTNSDYNSNGGGATDFRMNDGNWNDVTGLRSRIMVAGGGGGCWNGRALENAGVGGNLTGGQGNYVQWGSNGPGGGSGGTQTSGGRAGGDTTTSYNGQFGYATAVSNDRRWIYYSGGGGGYWGGGAGGAYSGVVINAGGGSSFISGYKGAVAVASSSSTAARNGSAGTQCTQSSAANDITCSYHYSGKIFVNGVMKSGAENLPTHDGSGTTLGNVGGGYAKITRGDFISSNYFLSDLSATGGIYLSDFQPNSFDYQINVGKYVSQTDISATAIDSNAVVTGDLGHKFLDIGYNYFAITVTAEDGTSKTYNLTILREGLKGKHSSEVYKFVCEKNNDTVYTQENVYTYEMDAFSYQTSFNIDVYTFDEDATYVITGNDFITQDSIIKVVVSAPGVQDSIYIISLNYFNIDPVDVGISYSGQYYKFVTPAPGLYTFELWGAQGGGSSYGAKGGYTKGSIILKKGEVFYIYVGAQGGSNSSVTNAGGWNGGGYSGNNRYNNSYGGGGATDIRILPANETNKSTWNEIKSLRSRIMVAGGGATSWCCEGYTKNPTPGGGLKAANASGSYDNLIVLGATQLNGGGHQRGTSITYNDCKNGKFGYAPQTNCDGWGGGGGGGYYGGGTGNGNSGSGGSSYVSGLQGAIAVSSVNSTEPRKSSDGRTTCTEAIANNDITCSYHYSGYIFSDAFTIAGSATMPNQSGTGTMVGNTGNGYARITGDFLSDNNYLSNITTDIGEWDKDYKNDVFEYDIEVSKYDSFITVFTTTYNIYEQVNGDGVTLLEPGMNTIEISVTAQDGQVRIYTLNVNRKVELPTAELYKIDIDNDIQYVGEDETEFEFIVSDNKFSFNPTGYAYDPDTTITYSGFGYVKQSKTCYIITNNPNANPSQIIYKIELIKSEVSSEVEFNYTGTVQTYTAPEDGYYQLEVWGASGGGYSQAIANAGSRGGAGGYATGLTYLEKNEIVYIVVGGAGYYGAGGGFSGNTNNPYGGPKGGYNGGGYGGNSASGSGGGATHIATQTGQLKELNANRTSVLIVAGGGGGADNGGASKGGNDDGSGGSGGGYIGGNARINGGYSGGTGATQSSGSSFGQGGNVTTNTDTGGGGGGYFGGIPTNHYNGGAGGGSGYIASSKLVSVGDYTKHMTCYECSASSDTNTLTKVTSKVSTSAVSDYAKQGNGYAKITYINFSSDNYLKTLKATDVTKPNTPVIKLNEVSTDDSSISENISLNVDSNVTQLKFESKPNDSKATIVGNNTYTIPAGDTKIELIVTAENSQTRTYTITVHRDADTNIYPDDIEINGLVQSFCNQSDDYCVLTNDVDDTHVFNKNIDEYYMTVPSRIKQVKFNVIKGQYFQEVSGAGIQDLSVSSSGTTDITIDIKSEYCVINNLNTEGCTSSFTYHITRDTASDTDLRNLFIDNKNTTGDYTIDEGDENLTFDFKYENPDVYDYYFSVPNEWTNVKYLTYTLDAPGQEVEVTGNDVGAFDTEGRTYTVFVKVTAPNKVDVATYRLHVYRELNSNIYLSKLLVNDESSTNYPFTQDFKKSIFDYEVTIPYEVNKVVLDYAPEVNTTNAVLTSTNGTVSGKTISNLPTGKTTVSITTTSQIGVTGLYTITLTRTYNNDSSLSNLIVKTGDNVWTLDPTPFAPETLTYTVNVGEGITEVTIIPTVNDTVTPATYKLLDNNRIVVGTNTKRVLVTAEDKTYSTYTINVVRPVSTDNTLKTLTVTGSDSNNYGVALEEDTYAYSVNVPNEVTFVNVTGVKNNALATVSGNGKYYLKTGNNTIYVDVVAENKVRKQYVLTVFRAYSSDTYVSSISVTNQTNVVSDITELNYTINVPYTTTKTNLLFTPHVNTTYITATDFSGNNLNAKRYNNSYILPISLVTGDNKFKLVTLAEDNTTTLTYNVNVVKAPSDDATLKTIRLKETRLRSTSIDKTYTAKLPYNVDPAHLIVEVNDSNSNYVVTVPEGLTIDTETNAIGGLLNETDENKTYNILITVTAEDLTVEVYTIELTMQAFGNASNYLTDITVDKGTLTPTFDMDEMYYEVLVENEVKQINVSGTLDDSDASVSGFGAYNLVVGENEINVVVTATDGLERVYQIIVTRKPSSDATLSKVSIKDASLSPSFNKNTLEYTTSVDNTYIDFTNITTSSDTATYEVINNEPGTLVDTGDSAEVTIKVTAEDKVTTKEYKINVSKLPSGNNNLASLSVAGYSLIPTFDKSVTSYRVYVENDVTTSLVEAAAEEKNATITGTGTVTLTTGNNSVTVTVTSENGSKKSYSIIINRAYNSNAKLDLLTINNGSISPEFESDVDTYNTVIDYSVTSLDMSIVPVESTSTYQVIGNSTNGDSGSVVIRVTAEDKTTTKDYSINYTKDISSLALLKSLSEVEYNFTSKFNSYIYMYNMDVNYETTSLDLTAIPINPNAHIDIQNNTLTVGDNLVTVKVTSEDGTQSIDYVINVKRNKEVNNYLDYLFNDYGTGDFNETFSKTHHRYSLTVDSDTDSIILYGEKQSRDSILEIAADNRSLDSLLSDSVSYLGTFGLNKGTNEISINVTNQGIPRIYYVTIIRLYNSDKELLSLVAKGNNTKLTLTPEFTLGRTEGYSINVDKDTNMIELIGDVSPLAKVSGLEDLFLEPGVNNHNITITAEDGSTSVIPITITKEANDVANLIDLVPSSGTLNPPFGYEVSNYTLDLDSSVNYLSFDYMLEDGNATVSGASSEEVPFGNSTRTIVVTAEDRTTTRTYTINISKIISEDADLLNLQVKDYDYIDKVDETTKVTFNKDVLEYYVIVDNSKKTLSSDDLIVQKSNQKSKVTYSDPINILTKEYSEFDCIVTAEDGITRKTYKIFIRRELGSSSDIIKVNPSIGYLETTFYPDTYNYVWVVPVNKKISIDKLGYVLRDENATVESEYVEEENLLRIVVTSEDGSSVSTYVIKGAFDYNKNVLLESLNVFDDSNNYPFEPEVSDDVFTYTAHVYEDLEEVTINLKPQAEEGVVKYDDHVSSNEVVSLPDETNTFIFTIVGEDGVTEQEYTIIVKKDVLIEETISSLEVVDENNVCTSKTCILNPVFSSSVTAYKTTVPYEYEILNLRVGLNEQQSVKYFIYEGNTLVEINNQEYELELGTTNIYINVYDYLGKQTKTYRLSITRNGSTNTKLNSLTITKDGVTYPLMDKDDDPISFSNDNNEYYVTVPYTVEDVVVNYVKNDDEQKVTPNGYNYFDEGEVNDISVKVTAPDKKTSRTIIIHAYRESQYEVFLTDITVASGVVWELSPTFDKKKTSYVVNVTNGTEYVKVEGFGDLDTQVSAAETRLIDTGVNEFEIVASKTFDGEVHTKTYTVTVIRPIASEVYLSSLVTSSTIDGEYTSYKNELGDTISFDRGTTDYYLEVSPGIKNLDIIATPGREEWNVNIYGNNFATGKNIVSIIVYNEEYTTSRTYQLMVTVKPSQDSSLTGIRVYDEENEYGISSEDFNASEDNTYTVNVSYDIEKVSIKTTPTIEKSVVIGEGEYYLDYGNNEIVLTSIAEDGIHTSTSIVNVYREYDLFLSDIKVDESSIEDFINTTDTYELTVTNDVKKLDIEGIPEESNVNISYSIDSGSSELATITEEGILYTGVGLNKVVITVTAPDNTFKNYYVNIMREQSDNNYLEYLEFDEGIFREPFEKTKQEYSMYILDTATSLDLSKAQIVPEDSTATYAVSGYAGLSKTASNTVTVAVTSESGKVRNYTIEVILKPESFFMHYLKSLKLSYKVTNENVTETNEATLSPIFAQIIRNYTVTVPYSVSSITTNAIPLNDDDDAILSASTESGESLGDATYPLNFGRNVISIRVTSRLANSDGSFGMYKVIVYRSMNATATLQSLAVENHLLSPSFNTNRTSYNIDIDSSEEKLNITAIPTDPGATVEIIGNGNFKEGNNTITIKVTAADNVTTKNYYIIANCTLSDNNYLKSIDVKDQLITPQFVKTNTGVYLANVDENVSNVYITGIKEDVSSSLEIITANKNYTDKSSFSMNLNPGNNYVYFAVTSAAGNTRTYTLNIFKGYSSDNKLKELIVSDGVLVPDFESEGLVYNVTLDGDLALLNTVTVIGIKNHPKATVIGNGDYTLNETGTTTVKIKVKAQSGDEREYTVNFIKKEAPSSKLKLLKVYEGELNPEFSNDGYKYYLTVPYEVTSLDLTLGENVLPEDSEATVTITGNEDFKVGINIVTIKVTATNGDTKTYLIYVTRSILASNYLSDLYVEDYQIEPEFNADTLYYTLTVGSNVESVHVYAEKEEPQSTLEINGSVNNDKVVNLNYGENKVYFTVTSENGASRTYTLSVTRSDSDEYYLLTLSTNIGTWNKEFNKDTNDYVIDVPAKTNMIVFSGTTSVGSTVEGLDSVQIKNGENNHKIVVTSPSGLKNTYNFTINRPSSNNANALITSNQGDLTLENDIYKLSVDDSISQIKFIVTPEDSDAKVVMNDSYALSYGKNEITIKVIAEDGITEKEYSIEIYRYKDIESISYDEDEIILNVGSSETPTYVINPEDTDYKDVTFRSDDETIATVDSTGKITGVENGITYVYVISSSNNKIYDWIKVNVASTKITSSVYTVWHEGDSENNLANVDFSYVIDANDKTKVDQFIDNFDNNRENLKVFSGETMIEDYSNFVGSGMILKLIINDHVYDEVVIVIRGDNGTVEKPGNGIITSTDYATLSSILAGLTLKTPMTSLLYDLNKNKILTVTDLSPLSLYIAGKATFSNLNGL